MVRACHHRAKRRRLAPEFSICSIAHEGCRFYVTRHGPCWRHVNTCGRSATGMEAPKSRILTGGPPQSFSIRGPCASERAPLHTTSVVSTSGRGSGQRPQLHGKVKSAGVETFCGTPWSGSRRVALRFPGRGGGKAPGVSRPHRGSEACSTCLSCGVRSASGMQSSLPAPGRQHPRHLHRPDRGDARRRWRPLVNFGALQDISS